MNNPNISLWSHYQETAAFRGELAAQLLLQHCNLQGARILDAGCGSGGISLALIKHGALVKAIDPDYNRINQLSLQNHPNLEADCLSAESLDEQNKYDIIILNDVLEHTQNPNLVIQNCNSALVPGGLLYLVTPNRGSIFNIFCDPHYSLPLISMFPRKWTRLIIAKVFKWHSPQKPDFPELLSFSKLEAILLKHAFNFHFINQQAVKLALNEPRYIWCRHWHLKTINLLKTFKLNNFFLTLVNNKNGYFNKLVNPTWYIIAKRND